MKNALVTAIDARTHAITPQHTVLYVGSGDSEGAVYLATNRGLSSLDIQLVRVFATNIAAGFANASLFEKVDRLAHFDADTGLPNRLKFTHLLSDAAQEKQTQLVALLDIRRFGELYHALGSDVGTDLLAAIATRLKRNFKNCGLGRVGDDVFALVGSAELLSPKKLLGSFDAPFEVGMHSLQVDVSMALAPVETGIAGAELLRRADVALREAKQHDDADWWEYDSAIDQAVADDVALIRRLREAFKADELTLWFQPQYDAKSAKMVGVEALARWPTAEGFVPPGRFIPLAERTGLMRTLGLWTLKRAVKAAKSLLRVRPNLDISVNISVEQLRRSGIRREVEQALASAELPSEALTLEVTETSFASPDDDMVTELQQLRGLGTKVALDDFGTGYASLGYLRWLPIDELKLDKMFVDGLASAEGSLLCRTIADLGEP